MGYSAVEHLQTANILIEQETQYNIPLWGLHSLIIEKPVPAETCDNKCIK